MTAALASIPSPSSGALTIGPLSIHAYGLMIALGVIAAVWLLGRRLEASGVGTREDASSIAVWAVIAGVICFMFSVLFAGAGVIVYFWDTYRFAAIVGVVLVFAAASALLLWRCAEIAKTSPVPFATTIAEIDKDRAALARTMNLPPTS